MSVTSKEITTPRSRDWSLAMGRYGSMLLLACFGGVIIAVNGGFSVAGLERIASAFNDAGRAAWAILALWSFPLPRVPGLPATQPVLPWLGVLAISALQITIIYRRLIGKATPAYILAIGLAASAYDLATTFYGLRIIAWIAAGGVLLQIPLAVIITFCFEFALSVILKELRKRA